MPLENGVQESPDSPYRGNMAGLRNLKVICNRYDRKIIVSL